jgi:hypothetical protein
LPFCPQDVSRMLPARINDRMLRFIVCGLVFIVSVFKVCS